VADTGEERLLRAAAVGPAVIVLDLGLPRLDGWEVARRLKTESVTSAIPLIALTAYADADSRKRALAAGVDAFLTKPCRPSQLVEEIRRQLGRARQSRFARL
jgi:CheY-like chemotaxis protein